MAADSVEKFIDAYKVCRGCKLNLHIYFYPLDRKTGVRKFDRCLSCVDTEKRNHG